MLHWYYWCENVSLFLLKNYPFKILALTFSSKLDWGSYSISITKTVSKKIGALIYSIDFISPEVALYFYKSTIRPCMEYCCHAWAVAPSCYLELLSYKNRYVGLFFLHLLPHWNFGHRQDKSVVVSLVNVHLNWFSWFHFFIVEGGLLVIAIDCMIFLSPFLDVTRISMLTVYFLAQLDSGILFK